MDRRLVGALAWLVLVVGYIWFARSRDLGAVEAAEEIRTVIADRWWGPVLFIVLYTLRPLVFFPASILTVLGGLAFGPVWGVIWTVVAANLSTAVTYGVGRFFGSPQLVERFRSSAGGLMDRAINRPFETTLVMRLLYLPFDLVGYVAGFLHLRFVPFALGSAIGILPGTVAFVGFGASIESLDEGVPSVDLRILLASFLLAIAGSFVSRLLRRRQPSLELTP